MSFNSMFYLLVSFLVLIAADAATDRQNIETSDFGGLILPPELYESTRLANLLARPSAQFKMKRDYDFVRFGRSAPSKKASYDYIRFGRK